MLALESENAKARPLYINAWEDSAKDILAGHLRAWVSNWDGGYGEIVILCIGTDRATGDSLGPLTGHLLGEKLHIPVYGSLEKPVHAQNIHQTMDIIRARHTKPLIVAVDACLGRSRHIGYLTLGKGALSPGAGVKKDLPKVGHIFITGIVNFSGVMELIILQNTRLHIVMKMADVIAEGIYRGLA